tara:strand:- start:1791 stop:4082 length:2292 start_codon:yes stop_codon:yes gene_type:complete
MSAQTGKNTLDKKMKVGTSSYLGYERGSSSASSKDPDVLYTEEILEKYDQERELWSQKFIESNDFRNGKQWTKEQKNALEERGQAAIVINRMHPMIETAKAMLTAKRPQFRATARDDSDRKTAKIFSDLFQWVWEKSSSDMELKQCIDDYYVGGLGYMYVYQNPHADMGKGEIIMKSIHPLDVYVDPNSRDRYFRDAQHLMVAKLIPDSEALKIYPEFEDIILSSEEEKSDRYPTSNLNNSLDQVMMEDFDRSNDDQKYREYIERYTKFKTEMYHVFDTTNKYECMLTAKELDDYLEEPYFVLNGVNDETIVTDYNEVQRMMVTYEETDGVYHMMVNPETGQPQIMPGEEHEGSIPNSTVLMELNIKQKLYDEEKILANKILCDRIELMVCVGGKMLYRRILPISEYPIVPMANIHNRNPYPESDVRLYRPLQEYINKIRSLIIAHASTSTNTKLLLPRGSVNKKQLEMEWGRAGTAVIEFDAELGQPIVAGPVPLPNELYKNESEAKHDLEYGFGIYEIMQGGNDGAPSTYRGTVAIDEYGQRRMKSRQDDLESMLNELAKRAIPLIQQLYTQEKIIRILEPSGTQKEYTVNQELYDNYGRLIEKVNDITVGTYDIKVVAGSTLPSNRFAQFDYYMELYKAGLIDQIELLKKTEVVDVEGVLRRHGQMVQLQQQVEAQQEEIKELKGDLQTADREAQHARKRVEIEKFKTQLKNIQNRSDKAGQLYEERLKDKLKTMEKEIEQEMGQDDSEKQPAGDLLSQL